MEKIAALVLIFIAVCYFGGVIDSNERLDVRNEAFKQSQTLLRHQDSVIGSMFKNYQKSQDSVTYFKTRNAFIIDSLKSRKVWIPKKDTLSIKIDTLK